MWPERIAGKRYLGTSLLEPKVGRTVLAKTGTGEWVIKKVLGEKDDQFILGGTVSWASSYTVAKENILGIVF